MILFVSLWSFKDKVEDPHADQTYVILTCIRNEWKFARLKLVLAPTHSL